MANPDDPPSFNQGGVGAAVLARQVFGDGEYCADDGQDPSALSVMQIVQGSGVESGIVAAVSAAAINC